jgi:translocation and assembly module TamA
MSLLAFHSPCLLAEETPPAIQMEIKGVNSEMEDNIRSSLNILNENVDFEDSSQWISQYKQHTRQEILFALQPFGYYSPKIDIHLFQKNKKWNAQVNIELGDPVRIGPIHFVLEGEGRNENALQGLNTRFTLKSGDVFNHEKYEQGKKELLTPAIEAGYLNAIFTEHRVEVDIDEKLATIYLTLNTGKEHYFGPVSYEKTLLSPKFLDRYLSFQSGEVYAPEKVLLLQSKLSTSDYFAKVNVKPNVDENSNQVPIQVELEDAKPNQYLLGIGYGTDTGIRGRAGWLRRRVNSMGHRFLAEARLSEIYTKVEADYIIPGKHPETDTLKIRGGYFEDQFNEQPSTIYEAAIVQERQLGRWQRRLSFSYVNETFPAFITYDQVTARYLLPNITFTQVKRDKEVAPTRGRKIEINLRGSVDTLFSDTSFIQSNIQTKWLHPYSETLKLLARLDLGATLPDNVENIPLSQRFYAGGDLSLRGYAYRSLPLLIDKNGNYHPAGGTYLAIGSLEIVKTIKKPFGVSAFIDAGNAFRDNANEIAAGPGVGIEWQTPLGPLKVALAKPLTKNAASYRIHVMFGPEI